MKDMTPKKEEKKDTSMSSPSSKVEITSNTQRKSEISGFELKINDTTVKYADEDNESIHFPFQKAKVSRFFSDEEHVKQPSSMENASIGRRSTQMDSGANKLGFDSTNQYHRNSIGNIQSFKNNKKEGYTQSGYLIQKNNFIHQSQIMQHSENYVNLPDSKTSLISDNLSNLKLGMNELHPELIFRPPTMNSSKYQVPSQDLQNLPKYPTQSFHHSPQLSNPSVRAINRSHTNEMLNNIQQPQYPILTPTPFPQPYYGQMYLQMPYNYPVELMPNQIPYYQTIQNLHGFKESSTNSSKLSSSNSGNQNLELTKPKQKKSTAYSSSVNYNYMTIEEIQKLLPQMCKEQLGCRFLQSKVESIPKYAEKYILPIIFNQLLEIILDQFGNYLMQKILDTVSSDTQSSIFKLVSLFIIYKDNEQFT